MITKDFNHSGVFMRTTIFSFLGAPGSGKGTQATVLCNEYGFQHIVTGDLIRAQRQHASQNAEAKEITERYDKGIPQPDSVVTSLVFDNAEKLIGATGIIFDPFPLSLGQAEMLEHWAHEHAGAISDPFLIYFVIHEEESVKRLLLRAKTEGRSDDKEEVIRYRYQQYAKRADELKNYYTTRNRYIEIDGTPPIAEVTTNMKKVLSDYKLL
ncbi:MAG: hypothetical protein COT25_01965 [Candidatus Kerfeldbacteria bacterium CG08_land_8_20_14_0_20_42_7]|uniref:Adenylate kinase n=1 Tax=Candidatus Kerfeldbacteria bacterium CG08_land_8_20_14_0_20_42_7 TaxID=2014245 RepID=A0A2H0YV75_9BACT|nr:MAG: hypothetical protein COT25_01965 [Candidatus Kerfeldbacteria bacterium CG08_land_8_20_14_0_20_42_7]